MANNNKSTKTPAKAAKPAQAPVSRVQRSLMYITGSVLGFGILAIIALLIGEATVKSGTFESSPLWGVVAFIPNIALPLGFILMIVLLVITFVKRSRAAEGAGK